MTHGELFAGISGFGSGFAESGIETVWHVEIDPKCQSVLRRHYPDGFIFSDVCGCGRRNLTPVDIVSFGSPCQDLSVAGRRAGLEGSRSGLFFEAIRIVRELNPAFAVWENVPGAFSSNAGRDFAAVLGAFRDIGARDIAWRTLDAQYFGVAQRRRRIFLVADFRGERAAEVLFERTRLCGNPAQGREAGARVAASLTRGSASGRGVNEPGRRCEDDVNIVAAFGGNNTQGPIDVATACNAHGGTGRMDFESETFIAHTLRAEGFDASEDGTGRGTPIVPIDLRQASRGEKLTNNRREGTSGGAPGLGVGEPGDPAFTVSQRGQAIAYQQQAYIVKSTNSCDKANHAIETNLARCLDSAGFTVQQGGTVVSEAYQQHGSDVGPMGTLRSGHGDVQSGVPFVFTQRTRDGEANVECSDVAFCLDSPATGGRKKGGVVHQMAVRRLTPRECERLQGFPDDWTRYADDGSELSDSARYRMLGNAVNRMVSAWIGKRLVTA
jgi:DNA (cytosine-5)-methyltransferase 1